MRLPRTLICLTLATWVIFPLTHTPTTQAAPADEQDKPNQPDQPKDKDTGSQRVTGKVDAVTVYRGQAMVTRRVELPQARDEGKGDQQPNIRDLVVTDLPEQVIPGSIYAEGGQGLTVRSVQYRTRPVSEDVRKEVRSLDQKIRDFKNERRSIQRHLGVLRQRTEYLNELQNFTAATANAELTKGVLNAKTLKALTDLIVEQREQIAERELELNKQERQVDERLELLGRRKQQVANSSTRTAREALVSVQADQANQAAGTVALHYLVRNANWSPSYNARTGPERKHVRLEQFASVQQRTGEDWPQVKMTLSTATPALASEPPQLEPLNVTLSSSGARGGKGQQQAMPARWRDADFNQAKQQLRAQQKALNAKRNAQAAQQQAEQADQLVAEPQAGQSELGNRGPAPTANQTGADQANERLNVIAGKVQVLEILRGKAKSKERRATMPQPASDQVVSVTYDIDGRTSLPSRSDRRIIRVASLEMPGTFYHKAIPVLSEHVYEQATATNDTDTVLLGGPVSSYVDGRFVGRGSIPTVAKGQQVDLGFGIDPALNARRRLVRREEKAMGGNRVIEFAYQLTLENYADQPRQVRLLERLPVSKDGDALRVELLEMGKKPVKKPGETNNGKDKGILRWDLEVPAGATGDDALGFTYSYEIEYDRQMTLTGVAEDQ